jgi:ketosteroid isomerase-like protein
MNRKTLKYVFVLITISIWAAFAASGQTVEQTARNLARFETEWLTANLNGDGRWVERSIGGKQNVRHSTPDQAEQRETLTKQLLNVQVPDGAMKVRIIGTVSFLTNDPAKNRSFNFLDTFNRKGVKWEVIASSFAPTGDSQPDTVEPIEKEIRGLEKEAAKAILEKNEAAITRFFTADSVTNDPRGTLTRGYSGIIDAMRTGLIHYYSFERAVESVQVFGTTAVTMGNEIVVVKDASGRPGDTVKRRFTNVWMRTGPSWQIVARHANVVSVN